MSNQFETKLTQMGLTLPEMGPSVGAYEAFVVSRGLVFVSGQLPRKADGSLVCGRLGEDLTLEQGADAARLCALWCLAVLKKAANGELGRLVRCLEVGGFVCSSPSFTDHPKVINGASQLFCDVLGEVGKHARFAVGAPSLPLGVAVEVKAVFEVKDRLF